MSYMDYEFVFICSVYCDHRVRHVLTHSCPTLRSSELRDIMDVEQEFLGVHAVVAHQPRHRRAMSVKILLLHPPRVGRVDIQQAHDEGAHADRKSTRLNSSH